MLNTTILPGASGTRYDPNEHIVRVTAFGSFLRNHFNSDALFTFQHMRTGKWVVGEWLKGPWTCFRELAILGDKPTGTRDIVHSLEQMDKASPGYETRKRRNRKLLSGFHQEQDRLDAEDAADMADNADFLRRQGQFGGGKHIPRHYVVPG